MVAAQRGSHQSEAERTRTSKQMTTRSGQAYTTSSRTIKSQIDMGTEQQLAGIVELLEETSQRSLLGCNASWGRKQKEEEECAEVTPESCKFG